MLGDRVTRIPTTFATAPGFLAGDSVALTGKYVAPKRIVDDTTYPTGMKTYLLTPPFATLKNETIFVPPEV